MGTTPIIESLRPREDTQKTEDEGKRSLNNK